jgi:hypothetical protein
MPAAAAASIARTSSFWPAEDVEASIVRTRDVAVKRSMNSRRLQDRQIF